MAAITRHFAKPQHRLLMLKQSALLPKYGRLALRLFCHGHCCPVSSEQTRQQALTRKPASRIRSPFRPAPGLQSAGRGSSRKAWPCTGSRRRPGHGPAFAASGKSSTCTTINWEGTCHSKGKETVLARAQRTAHQPALKELEEILRVRKAPK